MPTSYINGEDLIFALDMANSLREAMEGEKLDALPFNDATPNDASNCVLARAFNFDCSVDYDKDETITIALEEDERVDFTEFLDCGAVGFASRPHAEALAAELGVPVVPGLLHPRWRVPIPTRVARIARLFDEEDGREELDGLAKELGWPTYY